MSKPFIHALADVHSTAIGASTRLWQFVVVLAGAKIGQDGNICSHCLIENDVVIGDRVTVKSGVQLHQSRGRLKGDRCAGHISPFAG